MSEFGGKLGGKLGGILVVGITGIIACGGCVGVGCSRILEVRKRLATGSV